MRTCASSQSLPEFCRTREVTISPVGALLGVKSCHAHLTTLLDVCVYHFSTNENLSADSVISYNSGNNSAVITRLEIDWSVFLTELQQLKYRAVLTQNYVNEISQR